jgi:hypothetical protein
LKPSERQALQALAKRERRDPREQAALILVRELERVGALTPAKLAAEPQPAEGAANA